MLPAMLTPGMGFSLFASAEARFTATLFARLEAAGQIESGQAAKQVLDDLQTDAGLLLRSLAPGSTANIFALEQFHKQEARRLFPENTRWNERIENRRGFSRSAYRGGDQQVAQAYLHLWRSVLSQGVREFVGSPRSWEEASRVIEAHYMQTEPQPPAATALRARALAWIGLEALSEREFNKVLDAIAKQSREERSQSIRFVIVNIGAVAWSQLPTKLIQRLFKLSEGLGGHPVRPQVQRDIIRAIDTSGYDQLATILLRTLFP